METHDCNLCANSFNLDKSKILSTVTFILGLDNPEAFAVDWLSKNMYFSSYNLDKNIASISVATLQGTFRRELIKKDLGKPNSIALDPYGG